MSEPHALLVSMHTDPRAIPTTGDAGGMNIYILDLSVALASQGWRVSIATRAADADSARVVTVAPNVAVHYLPVGEGRILRKQELPELTGEFGDALTALAPVSVVHSHYWLSGVAGAHAARRFGVPHIATFHTLAAMKDLHTAPGDEKEPPVRHSGERDLARSADAVVTSTASERELLTRAYAVAPERVHVIPPGVDTRLFHPSGLRVSERAMGSRPVCLMVGRVQPLKGQLTAIEAIARIGRPKRPRLLVVGEASPGRSEYFDLLQQRVVDLRLEEDVAFSGALERAQVAKLMRQATLVLVPSHSETFGMVATEAAASGTPVIASDTWGLRDSVINGETGILVHGHDAAEWGRVIERVLSDVLTLDRLGAGGRKRAESLTWTAAASAHSQLYESLMG